MKKYPEESIQHERFLISNFRRVLNVVRFLLGTSLASGFYMPMFWNTLSVPFHRWVGMKNYPEESIQHE
jgi:hypothetical protein